MRKECIKNVILVCIIAFLAISFIISQDEYHLDTCEEENCVKCAVIMIAKNLVAKCSQFVLLVLKIILLKNLLIREYKQKVILVQKSLVFQNVQLNE